MKYAGVGVGWGGGFTTSLVLGMLYKWCADLCNEMCMTHTGFKQRAIKFRSLADLGDNRR